MSTDAVRAALAELVAATNPDGETSVADWRKAWAAARAALSKPEPSVVVPDGYRLVPIDVLRDVRDALSSFVGEDGWTQRDEKALDALNVHIAAAPSPPTPQEPTP